MPFLSQCQSAIIMVVDLRGFSADICCEEATHEKRATALSYAKRIRAYAFETLGRADHVLVPPAH